MPIPKPTPMPIPKPTPMPTPVPVSVPVALSGIALAPLSTPAGDINVADYVKRFTTVLRTEANKHGALHPIIDPTDRCAATDFACIADVGRRAGATLVVYGTLIHSSEGDRTEIHLDAVDVASLAHRSWDDAPLDSDAFFASAAETAVATLTSSQP